MRAQNGSTCWPHYPAVIGQVDHMEENEPMFGPGRPGRVDFTGWSVTLDGRTMEFAHYDQAQAVASMLVDPDFYGARQDWREHIGCEADYLGLVDVRRVKQRRAAYDQLIRGATIAEELAS